MSGCVAAVMPWRVARSGVSRLQASVLEFNEGSVQVLLRNGFIEDRRLRAAVLKRGQLHDLRLFRRLYLACRRAESGAAG